MPQGQPAHTTATALVPPSEWVERYLPRITHGGTVLDLAAGRGRHGRLALQQGYRVMFVDRSVEGLRDVQDQPGATVVARDLEDGSPLQLPEMRFDGVIVTNYLFRPLLPQLAAILNEKGILIYETFAKGNEAFGRPRNPDFLLDPNELLTVFCPLLQIVAYEHGTFTVPKPRVCQRLCAMRVAD